NLGGDLAIGHDTKAGNHRVFVHVETATSLIQQFHRPLLILSSAWGPVNKNSRKRAPGPFTTRGDSLRCSRNPGSNLYSGLIAPMGGPTSVPTAQCGAAPTMAARWVPSIFSWHRCARAICAFASWNICQSEWSLASSTRRNQRDGP